MEVAFLCSLFNEPKKKNVELSEISVKKRKAAVGSLPPFLGANIHQETGISQMP